MRLAWLLLTAPLWPTAQAAVCNPADFSGAYGFLLTGDSKIGFGAQPAAALGRLVLDDSGKISGTVSAGFTGLLLGNPVTGGYEAHTDCSITWSLQDDSGNFQHFQGTATEDAKRITFRQTDPGGAPNGTMLRTSSGCDAGEFQGRYKLTLSGHTVNVDSGQVSGDVSLSVFWIPMTPVVSPFRATPPRRLLPPAPTSQMTIASCTSPSNCRPVATRLPK